MATMKKKSTKAKSKPTSVRKNTKKPIAKKKVLKVKKKKISPIPAGYHHVTAYLIVNDANKAIDFYKRVFNAKEVMRMDMPGGKIMHAELKIGDSKIMLADECPEMNARSPQTFGGSPVSLHLYVKDADKTVELAVKSGAKIIRPLENMFYGDRSGFIEDPYGHMWSIATHIEDVSKAMMKKRAAAFMNKS